MRYSAVIILMILLFQVSFANDTWNINPDPNGEPWIVGTMPELTEEDSLFMESIPPLEVTRRTRATLPSHIDHSTSPHFRSIFSQQSNSCSQAAAIGYLFTYEINAARGVSAESTDNQYPYMFTYNLIGGSYVNKVDHISQILNILPDRDIQRRIL